jgi:hypothetical protein
VAPTEDAPNGAPVVGTKASGLERLPRGWTPPYLALGSAFADAWRRSRSVRAALTDEERTALARLVDVAQRRETRLIVRSDSASEIVHPGRQRTRVSDADFDSAISAIRRTMNELGRSGRPIVQVAIEPSMLGLLSNERRITRTESRFLAEGFLDGRPIRWLRPRSIRARRALRAGSVTNVIEMLEHVLARLEESGQRLRIEWAWDGERVWILQADNELSPPDPPSRGYLDSAPARVSEFLELPGTDFRGVKTRRTATLSLLGLPAPPLAASADENGQSAMRRLEAMLRRFKGRSFVVRTDVLPEKYQEPLLLPTSAPASTFDEVKAWALKTSRLLSDRGLRDEEWAFIASELIPARVSAWASAKPNSRACVIDALWGFPDGLLHLAHDTFLLDGASEQRRIAHKPACLLPGTAGWRYAKVPAPLDWLPTLASSELRQIAEWTRTVAKHVDDSVQLMFLARVGGRRGPRGIYPFYFTTLPSANRSHAPQRTRNEITIERPTDLWQLNPARVRPTADGIRLAPASDLLRDPEFLHQVGKAAAAANVPISFHGSVLGHAFHLLASAGAVVIPSGDVPQSHEAAALMPVVVRRRPGLARVQNVSWKFWFDLLSPVAQATGAESAAENTGWLTSVIRHFLELPSAGQRARASVRAGRFQDLPQIEEGGTFHVPLPPDAPGVVPLFMDEARPSVGKASNHFFSVHLPTPDSRGPQQALMLARGVEARFNTGVVTLVFSETCQR